MPAAPVAWGAEAIAWRRQRGEAEPPPSRGKQGCTPAVRDKREEEEEEEMGSLQKVCRMAHVGR